MTQAHPHAVDDHLPAEESSAFSFAHLRRYRDKIVLGTLAVAVVYGILAIVIYLLAPSQRITSQTFRLQFTGAEIGQYPNGVKFNPVEIVDTPTLARTYAANPDLARYVSFDDFSHAVFILEANPEYERLVNDYRGRLNDPRLTPVDRDRLQREFETKRESIAKNSYSVNYMRTAGAGSVPDVLVRKTLSDILATWAQHAVNEQHVLEYRLSMLTPQMLNDTPYDAGDFIVAIEVLRSNLNRVLDNVHNLQKVPAAELVRSNDGLSLQEIQARIEDLKRFRLEPLVALVQSGGLIKDHEATVHFLETQLAYDQRQLRGQELEADQIRQAFAVYAGDQRVVPPQNTTTTAASPAKPQPASGDARGGPEALMPQLSDSFLDRLVSLTSRSADSLYRQNVAEEYRVAAGRIIPAQQAVDYDEHVLQQLKNPAAAGARRDPAAIGADIDSVRAEARTLVGKINEIYKSMSRNLNPSTELFKPIAPPVTTTAHSVTLSQLALYGILVVLAAFAVITAACLMRDRFGADEDVAGEGAAS